MDEKSAKHGVRRGEEGNKYNKRKQIQVRFNTKLSSTQQYSFSPSFSQSSSQPGLPLRYLSSDSPSLLHPHPPASSSNSHSPSPGFLHLYFHWDWTRSPPHYCSALPQTLTPRRSRCYSVVSTDVAFVGYSPNLSSAFQDLQSSRFAEEV